MNSPVTSTAEVSSSVISALCAVFGLVGAIFAVLLMFIFMFQSMFI